MNVDKNIVTILSIDPGLSTFGWAFSEYDRTISKLSIVNYGNYCPARLAERKEFDHDVRLYGHRIMSLCVARIEIDYLYKSFRPDFVCCEDAFFNRFRPTAYAALLQWITTIELFLKDKYKQQLYKMSPKSIKHAIGKGDSDKAQVLKNVLSNKQMEFKHDESKLIEHEWDACACGWAFSKTVLPDLLKKINRIQEDFEEGYEANGFRDTLGEYSDL